MPASQGATSARCARLAEKTLRAAAASEHAAVSSACASACKFHSRAAAGGALDAALAPAQALALMCLRERFWPGPGVVFGLSSASLENS